jgi:hypothetical protein
LHLIADFVELPPLIKCAGKRHTEDHRDALEEAATGNALPKRARQVLEQGRALRKEAKVLGR